MSNRLAVSRKMMETLKSHPFRVWLRIWQAHASQMPAQLSSGTTGCEKSGIWALYCLWYKCEMLGIIEIIEVSQVTQKLELDSARYVQSKASYIFKLKVVVFNLNVLYRQQSTMHSDQRLFTLSERDRTGDLKIWVKKIIFHQLAKLKIKINCTVKEHKWVNLEYFLSGDYLRKRSDVSINWSWPCAVNSLWSHEPNYAEVNKNNSSVLRFSIDLYSHSNSSYSFVGKI